MEIKYCFLLFSCLSLALWTSSVSAERPAHCLLPHPKGEGLCEMLIIGFYYNPALNECEQWSEGGCDTVGGHSYYSKEECDKECVIVKSKL